MSSHDNFVEPTKRRRPPAKTPEARENQLINLAYDQAELLMIEGRAGAPIIVHFLKMGTERDKLEIERLRNESEYLKKKTEMVDQGERMEALVREATEAMTMYRGDAEPEEYEVYD